MSAAAPVLSTETAYARAEQLVVDPTVGRDKLVDVYFVDAIADHIRSNRYSAPCLQFPDDLVRDSAQIASLIQARVDVTVYVLADTSYSPCCVDEIAAQHVHGDVVYHFGNACLNPTKSLPVVYVSRQEPDVDFEAVSAQLPQKTVILYPETHYTALALELAAEHANIIVALPSSNTAEFIPPLPEHEAIQVSPDLPNRVLTEASERFEDCAFVYLTSTPSESLLLHWSTVFSDICVVNPRGERLASAPALRKRYRHVQKVKSSGTIGILVNTLSLRDTLSLLERTKQAVTRAGKKYYTFVVGKPNVAKLGNFEAVDCWVVLGCPQGGVIVDDTEYFKPIVTPYELELAFDDAWTGKWLLDFNQIFMEEECEERAALSECDGKNDEEPLFDLVTGKFVFGNTPLREVEHLNIGNGELQQSSSALTVRNTVSTAAQKLQQRSWQGLGSDHAEITEESAELKKGRSGIARNYDVVL